MKKINIPVTIYCGSEKEIKRAKLKNESKRLLEENYNKPILLNGAILKEAIK